MKIKTKLILISAAIFAFEFFCPPRPVFALGLGLPVGGRFAPGLFDIFTPTIIPPCLLVTVVGPNPGVFNFTPIMIFNYFGMTPYHAGTNVLGLSMPIPGVPCPPALYMFGSSMTPGA